MLDWEFRDEFLLIYKPKPRKQADGFPDTIVHLIIY
jgi:hypothetical protein